MFKGAAERFHTPLIEPAPGQRHPYLESLIYVPHVRRSYELHILRSHTGVQDQFAALCLHFSINGIQAIPLNLFQTCHIAAAQVKRHWRQLEAKGRTDACARRHNDGLQAEFLCHLKCMDGSRPAEGHQGEASRV